MNERPELETIENQEHSAPIRIEYEISNTLGGNVEKHTISDFGLIIENKDAALFDGYIYTPEGNFGFEGFIRDAKIVLEDIKKYCELSRKVAETRWVLHGARQEVESAGHRYRMKYEEEPLLEARRKKENIESELYRLEYSLKEVAKKVEAYKL
jgi:hypothetical protein